jgi:hypothetical protein
MKTYKGSGGIAPCILNLGTRWRWVVCFTFQPLYPQGKSPSAHWLGGWVGPHEPLSYLIRKECWSCEASLMCVILCLFSVGPLSELLLLVMLNKCNITVKFFWVISWVKWLNGEQTFWGPSLSSSSGLWHGPWNIGLFTIQPLNPAENLKELHCNHSPGKLHIVHQSIILFCPMFWLVTVIGKIQVVQKVTPGW